MISAEYQFDPTRFERELEAIIREIVALECDAAADQATVARILRRYPREGGGFFSKSELIQGFRYLARRRDWPFAERQFMDRVRMKPVRTASGVAPVTVLTEPFPLPRALHLLPERRADAEELPLRRAGSAACRAAPIRPLSTDDVSPANPPQYGTRRRQGRAHRARWNLVVLSGALSDLVHRALLRCHERLRACRGGRGDLERSPRRCVRRDRSTGRGADARRGSGSSDLQRCDRRVSRCRRGRDAATDRGGEHAPRGGSLAT